MFKYYACPLDYTTKDFLTILFLKILRQFFQQFFKDILHYFFPSKLEFFMNWHVQSNDQIDCILMHIKEDIECHLDGH